MADNEVMAKRIVAEGLTLRRRHRDLVRLSVRGQGADESRARPRRAVRRGGRDRDRVRRHHRDGQSGLCRWSSSLPPSNGCPVSSSPRTSTTPAARDWPTRTPRCEVGLHQLRVQLRRTRAAARCRPARPATSPPRTWSACSRRWASTPGCRLPKIIDAARAAQSVLGRKLTSHSIVAGPIDWAPATAARPLSPPTNAQSITPAHESETIR